MRWPTEAFFVWWARQPEIIAADQQREEEHRRRAWQASKLEARSQRAQEKRLQPGLSRREVNLARRMLGITREEIARQES